MILTFTLAFSSKVYPASANAPMKTLIQRFLPPAEQLFKMTRDYLEAGELDSAYYTIKLCRWLPNPMTQTEKAAYFLYLGYTHLIATNDNNLLFSLTPKAESILFKNSDTITDVYLWFYLLYNKAHIHYNRQNFDSSYAVMKECYQYGLNHGIDTVTLTGVLQTLAWWYYHSDEYDKSIDNGEKAMKLYFDRYKEPSHFITNNYLALFSSYLMIGDLGKAIGCLQKGEKAAQIAYRGRLARQGLFYFYVGRSFHQGDLLDASLEYYRKAEECILLAPGNQSRKLVNLYTGFGRLYFMKADHYKAFDYFSMAYHLELARVGRIIPENSHLISNLAAAYRDLKQFDKALELYFVDLSNQIYPRDRSFSLRGISQAFLDSGNIQLALVYADSALNELVVNGIDDGFDYLYALFDKSTVMLDNLSPEGVTYSLKAANAWRRFWGGKNNESANCYHEIAMYYSILKDYRNSIQNYQLALIESVDEFNDLNIYNNPIPLGRGVSYNTLLFLKSKAEDILLYLSDSDLKDSMLLYSALEAAETAIGILEKLRNEYAEQSKYSLMAAYRPAYLIAVKAAYQLYLTTGDTGYLNKAFEYSGKSRASIFQSGLQASKALQFSRIPASLRAIEEQIRTSISFYEKQIYEESLYDDADAEKIKIWKTELFDLKVGYEKLIAYFENNYPDYYALKYQNSVPGFSDVQKKLAHDQALIEYVLGKDYLLTFLITSDSQYVFYSGRTDSLSIYLDRFVLSLRSFHSGATANTHFTSFCTDAYFLYNSLLKPLSSYIENKELIIIPDDKLGFLPFDALIDSCPSFVNPDFRKLPYVLRKHSVVYDYSAALFCSSRKSEKRNKLPLLAFAPDYGGLQSEQRSDTSLSMLSELKGSIKEARRVVSITGGKGFYKQRAGKQQFLENAKKAGILHLAMHTLVSDDNPLYSRLVFSGKDEDRLLNTYEIYNMQLTAELAVLSACNTGYGKLATGEGIMSLSRAFRYAGVGGIVMTLWPLDDVTGLRLFPGFYTKIAEGYSKPKALQKAKLDFLASADALHSHPYFWANSVCIGNPEPVSVHKVFSLRDFLFGWSGGALLTGILFAFFLFYRLRRFKAS